MAFGSAFRVGLVSVGVLAVGCPAVAAALPAPFVVAYSVAPAAGAIHDGDGATTGIRGAYRQAPAEEDRRWPVARRIGKVSGASLAPLAPAAMASTLRAAWNAPGVGDLVAVDEISAADFTPDRLVALRSALTSMGPDADRVILYVSPGLVQQVGRVDRRRPLPARQAALVATAPLAGATFVTAYHGGIVPFTREELARDLTGWVSRWPSDRLTRLHIAIGRATGTTQPDVWARVRSTPAGRALLANGPAAYGLAGAAEGLAWLREYRSFLAAPETSPASGDARVPAGGGLTLTVPRPVMRPGAAIGVGIARPGRAVVQLIPRGGTRRVIRVLLGPVRASVALPRDARSGRYRVRVVLLGDGIRDVAVRALTIRR